MTRFALLAAPLLAPLLALAATPAAAAPHTLDPNAYSSFVRNWSPATAPLCAAIRSEADWKALMHPAPVMGGNKPFGPDGDFWGKHDVLVYARVVPMGDIETVFRAEKIATVKGVLTVRITEAPPPANSAMMKAWLGVVVIKPVAGKVRFIENGTPSCSLDLKAGRWVSPPITH